MKWTDTGTEMVSSNETVVREVTLWRLLRRRTRKRATRAQGWSNQPPAHGAENAEPVFQTTMGLPSCLILAFKCLVQYSHFCNNSSLNLNYITFLLVSKKVVNYYDFDFITT